MTEADLNRYVRVMARALNDAPVLTRDDGTEYVPVPACVRDDLVSHLYRLARPERGKA